VTTALSAISLQLQLRRGFRLLQLPDLGLRPRVSEEVAQRENQQQHPVMQSFGAGKDIVLTAPLAASAQARRAVLTYRYAR
jgi:hypothetical protein